MKLSISLNIILAFALVLISTRDYFLPLIATKRWGEEYKSMMYNCDQAMRDHYIAKQAVRLRANPTNIRNLQSAEVGLLECHEYDKLRKKMIAWHVTPQRLSQLGLEALEEKSYELARFVEIHEIRY